MPSRQPVLDSWLEKNPGLSFYSELQAKGVSCPLFFYFEFFFSGLLRLLENLWMISQQF